MPASQRTGTSKRLEALAHAMEIAPAMVCALDGTIEFWGRGLKALYGWTDDEATGRLAQDLLATDYPIPRPQIMAELMEAGEWQGELLRSHRHGHRIVVATQ